MLNPALRWTLIALAVLVVLSVLALWSWGRFAARAQGEPASALAVAEAATTLDRLVQPLLAAQPAQSSGAAMLGDGVQAFVARARTGRAAERSLDAMYYIWHGDLTGHLLQHELMAAAERGVRVRLLLDDMNVAGRDDALLAMDAHPNLEVRLFNPGRNRASGLRRALEMGLRFVGFTRRMHNKAWIADNRLAVVGGRNVGDEYFDAAADTNFHDADLLLAGPAVTQASAVFDAFWNSAAVVPLRALHDQGSRWTAEEFSAHRQQWQDEARASPWVKALAERDSWMISPYFVPGETGTLLLAGQARRGVQVRVLTNSLAANDVPMVHAGYMDWRAPLLRQGVTLYELRPGQARTERELLGSSGASLHTKSFVVDGQRGFVGSFNFDPRSAQLNTEMGVVFDHAGLAAEVRHLFDAGTRPDSAWRVTLAEDGSLRWQGAASERVWTHEPETGAGLRALVWLLSWLPIESQL